jgi:hypothetical protein
MPKTIDITLKLSDQLTTKLRGAVNSATTQLGRLQSQMSKPISPVINQPTGLGLGDLVAGNLLSNAISSVASGVIAAGQMLASSIASAYTEAADINAGNLSATSANAALLGMGFAESAKMTDRITTELAKSAERLPGATKDYLQAFQGVSDTLSMSGGLTKQGLTDAGREMVELVAMLGKASGSGSGATSTVIGKMLGDTGSEALFRIDAFEKVPAFKAILEKDLEKAGKTLDDFFKMDAAAKQKQLVSVKKRLFSDDYVTQMNASMDNQMQVLQSQLFDPTAGMFGFLRKVRLDGDTKDTSVFTELGLAFQSLTGLIQNVTGMLGKGEDPMKQLAGLIRDANNWFASANLALQMVKSRGFEFNLDSVESNLGSGFSSIVDQIGQKVRSVAMSIFNSILDVVVSGQSGDTGFMIATKLGEAIRFTMDTVTNYLAANSGSIALAFGGGVAAIAQFAVGLLFGVATQVLPLLGSALKLGFQYLASASALVLASGVGVVTGLITGFVQQTVGQMSRMGSVLVSGATTLGNIASTGLGLAMSATSRFLGVLKDGIEGFVTPIQSAMSAIQSAISSLVSNIPVIGGNAKPRHMGNLGSIGFVGTASRGNLLGAIAEENSNKPPGSHLVIANSSELIVPRDKQHQVMNSQFSFTIQANTIKQVLQEVETNLRSANRQGAISMG